MRRGFLSLPPALLFWALCCLGACAVPSGMHRAERTELYFGLNKPGGGTVAEREWQGFVDREITPRFPQGLTFVPAAGQYRNAAGQLVKEPSRILILLHSGSREDERRLREIVASYKKAFSQESVLRCDQPARIGF